MPNVLFQGRQYHVSPEDFAAEGRQVDNGIGCYEFWGAQRNDVQIERELDSLEITCAEDEDGNIITDRAVLKELEEAGMKNPDDWARLDENQENFDLPTHSERGRGDY